MSVDALLNRLHKVQRTGTDRWTACCPAHDDKTPSLAIRELDDGRILLKCFAGCATDDVLDAVGLTFADLMPERLGEFKRERRPFYASDILKIMDFEAWLVIVCASALAKGEELTEERRERLLLAASRLSHAVEVSNGYGY